MAVYFLEHVRSKYFISTSELNEEFIQKLSSKSGYGEDNIRSLTASVLNIQSATSVTEKQLADYYKQFQKFYKYTE
jgi:predicted subunit of tRNA(5-methylaminomethyl-2-thiouridylate) methyltransferase